jgi:hypothetical protein
MPAGFINALDWAFGDGANDDAAALSQAAAAAQADGKHLWVPGTADSYDVGAQVAIPAGVSVKSWGRLRALAGIPRTAPVVVVGASGTANPFQVIEIALDNAGAADWAHAGFVGVRLYNPQNCLIDIRQVKGTTVGVEIIADGGHAAMNNEIRLGLLEDCRWAVQLTGPVRDNRLMLGRWSVAHPADVEKALWKIEGTSATGNLWISPSAAGVHRPAGAARKLSYLHTQSPMNQIWSLGDDAALAVASGDAHIVADGAAAEHNLVRIGRYRDSQALTVARINGAPAGRNGLITRRAEAQNQNVIGGIVV